MKNVILAAAILVPTQAYAQTTEQPYTAPVATPIVSDVASQTDTIGTAYRQPSTKTLDTVNLSFCDTHSATIVNTNKWVRECLGMKGRADYQQSDLAIQFGVAKAGETIEVTPKYTFRWNGPRASYLELSTGLFSVTGTDGEARFFDFDDIQSGSGFVFGAEYGLFGTRDSDARGKLAKEGIEKARNRCRTDRIAKIAGAEGLDVLELARQQCSGRGLWVWLRENRSEGQTTWSEVAGKIYEADNVHPRFVVGIKYRQAYDEQKFLTPSDISGFTPSTTLAEIDGAAKLNMRDVQPFSVKAYLGTSIDDFGNSGGIGLVTSIAYKNEYELSDAVKGKTLCAPDGTLTRCSDFNLAAPRKITEWVPGATLNVKFPQLGFVPVTGISAQLTWETESDRIGVQVPVYFSGTKDSPLSAGVRYFYRSSGEAPDGTELKKDEGFRFFVGTKFNLLNGR